MCPKRNLFISGGGDFQSSISIQHMFRTILLSPCAAGLDYMAGSGSIQLTSGHGTTSHSVTILTDDLSEGTESFWLTLSNPSIQFNGVGLDLQADEAARLQLGPDTATVEIVEIRGSVVFSNCST